MVRFVAGQQFTEICASRSKGTKELLLEQFWKFCQSTSANTDRYYLVA